VRTERGDSKVCVAGWADSEQIVVQIKDNGPGMSPDVAERVFEPFFTTKEVGEGTGLGLSICYGIVTGMGGSITVQSEEGAGTTFEVRLPMTTPAPDLAQQMQSKEEIL
jgi:signal transduction histidine kinase